MINLFSSVAYAQSEKQPKNINLGFNEGVTLSLSGSDEVICKAWLDNPTFATVDILGMIAGWENCDQGTAQILHIKRNLDLKLKHIPVTNKSLLTLVTKDKVTEQTKFHFYRIVKQSSTSNRLITVASAPTPQTVVNRRSLINSPVSKFNLSPEQLAERVDAAILKVKVKQSLPKASLDPLVRFSSLLKLGSPEHSALAMSGTSENLVREILKHD
ncbi:MAG: hypothetical protein WBM44_26530 [Waterburya sp.]